MTRTIAIVRYPPIVLKNREAATEVPLPGLWKVYATFELCDLDSYHDSKTPLDGVP